MIRLELAFLEPLSRWDRRAAPCAQRWRMISSDPFAVLYATVLSLIDRSADRRAGILADEIARDEEE